MDAQTVFAVAGLGITGGTSLVLITVYAVNTKGIANNALHKARNVETLHNVAVAHADTVYARKDVIGEKFTALQASLDDIKDTLKAIRGPV